MSKFDKQPVLSDETYRAPHVEFWANQAGRVAIFAVDTQPHPENDLPHVAPEVHEEAAQSLERPDLY